MEIYLVADTNLFFECKTLEELPWQELGYDPIIILLTKPVLDEIDKHKKANGRTRRRALEIFKRVREMIITSTTELVVKDSSPKKAYPSASGDTIRGGRMREMNPVPTKC